jgi:HTH-type transcriptional regulator, competence development regulator
MKFKISQKWLEKHVPEEGDSAVSAGVGKRATHAELVEEICETAHLSKLRFAFGRLIELERRKKGFSIKQLADRARLDEGELTCIEFDPRHEPDPSTVFQLASFFRIPEKPLMQLAGLTEARDRDFLSHAVRFAASSKPTAALTKEETDALESFVVELSKRQ